MSGDFALELSLLASIVFSWRSGGGAEQSFSFSFMELWELSFRLAPPRLSIVSLFLLRSLNSFSTIVFVNCCNDAFVFVTVIHYSFLFIIIIIHYVQTVFTELSMHRFAAGRTTELVSTLTTSS
ncbi:hypothetical protein BU24DRAFT_132364 [Aaosphaeria arxii CBS 175.79]|uniref:Uncharacterized protein n=1 Tax=Aaosphaeria arxii CBS 175.79 TaxID=1450172 RepID=A0A6A5Y499_9PLEO|nr:uncharacterized protein BU24DRAFT_132364 [Aaosphaeria arxii CBS 175.79]KAF2020023.1 hypothetical protein BU24DRAFT_132364 [Aaosphaeria arxii CBS 175.79]